MAVTDQTTADMVCSFCLMSADDVAAMIAGPGVFICDSCVAAFAEILFESKPAGITVMADVQQTSPMTSCWHSCPRLLPRVLSPNVKLLSW
jgi:hypothetical protein